MVIHCTVAVSTLNSRMSCGKSTVITVSVRMPMKAREPTATMAPMSLPGMRSSGIFLTFSLLFRLIWLVVSSVVFRSCIITFRALFPAAMCDAAIDAWALLIASRHQPQRRILADP